MLKLNLMKSLLVAGAAIALPTAANAAAGYASGNFGNMFWEARSMLVGTGPTNGGQGSTVNTAPMPAFSGTVGLLMGGFVCSGTLLSDRQTILTAAHCVRGVSDTGVTAFFRDPGSGVDVQFYYGGPGYTTQGSSNVFINAAYTGDVLDHNDIALVRLASLAPVHAASYDLFTAPSLRGLDATITGYGSTSSVGGTVGVNVANPNRLGWFRNGDNKLDFRLGETEFGTVWSSIFSEPFSQISHSYLFDFDNGRTANDTACRTTQAANFGGIPGTIFCNLGTGAREVGIAGGDSGGGSFINGKVATVNSYGLSFGTSFGDIRGGLQSSYGEFSGVVPVYLHERWITERLVPQAPIPEPRTWAMLIVGFGAVGFAARRRRPVTIVSA